MNSWRDSVQIWPVAVRKWMALSHSDVERRVSRAKSCRCVTRRARRKRRRGEGLRELAVRVLGVMLLIVRSFIGGRVVLDGSMMGVGGDGEGGRGREGMMESWAER